MKKILLIGKLTNVIQSLNESLSDHFNVQICPDSADLIKDMMRTLRPHMAIISVAGWDDVDSKVFDLFGSSYPDVSVLVIGTDNSREKFKKYYENGRFLYMESPIKKKELMEKCCKLLNVEIEDPEKQAENSDPDKKQILVVDDSPILLRSMKAMLEGIYKVSVSTSGEQALKMMAKKRPDLVLLDYEMPGYDGKKTLEMIRADEHLADIPVIFLTGVADKDDVMKVLTLKPDGYILKPPDRDKMLRVIREALDQ